MSENPYQPPKELNEPSGTSKSKYEYRGQVRSFIVVAVAILAANIAIIPWYRENFYEHANGGKPCIINQVVDALNSPGFPLAIAILIILWTLHITEPGWGDISWASGGFEQHMIAAIGAAITYGLVASLVARFVLRRRTVR